MQKHVGWLWIAGLFGLVAVADAQTSSSPSATTQFDGKYAFVSSAKVNETFMAGGTRPSPCPDRKAGPLTIANGQARYRSGLPFDGMVGSQGELAMRREPEAESSHGGITPGIELFAYGRIDSTGTARVRQTSNRCNYDFIWQKVKVQSPSLPIASALFDGTYAFASATTLNETFMDDGGTRRQCPERKAESLTIVRGQTQYSSRRIDGTARLKLEGTVGSQGGLAMRHEPESEDGLEFFASGRIDGNGTARVRQIGSRCNFEFTWQKENK